MFLQATNIPQMWATYIQYKYIYYDYWDSLEKGKNELLQTFEMLSLKDKGLTWWRPVAWRPVPPTVEAQVVAPNLATAASD